MSNNKLISQPALQLLLNIYVSAFVTIMCTENEVHKHPCTRSCDNHTSPRNCFYQFEVEKYLVRSKACYNCPYNVTDCFRPDCITADGWQKVVTVINRKMPGPDIQVCVHDTVQVKVINSMTEEGTSVHWHGLHQERTPYMDGVPFITQCPIASGTSFEYKFKAELPGTHFYHSHTGMQRSDGLYGSLIIRQPKNEDVHSNLYDYDLPEHVIITMDWTHEPIVSMFVSHYQTNGTNKPDTILVNGLGRYKRFATSKGKTIHTPLAKFDVVQGKRYRFRLINAGFLYCPIEVSFDNHTLILINSDGGDIKPVHADSFVSYAGERWDFIINANKKISNYWIKFKGLMDCGEKFNKAHSVAVLHYEGAPNVLPNSTVTYENMSRGGLQINSVNVGSNTLDALTVAELINHKSWKDPALKDVADLSLMLSFDFYAVDNDLFHKEGLYGFNQVPEKHRRYIPQINHISMKMPSFPILSQPHDIGPDTFCNENKLQNCSNTFCFCTYEIDLPLNATVEIILVDEGAIYQSNHPFHLHGYSFRVVALEKLGNSTTSQTISMLNETNKIVRNLKNPPMKDTITVPDGGYTVIRFYTKNPGYWLLHCHLDFHVESGMAVILKVGNTNDFPPVPKDFPQCGNYYQPDINNNLDNSNEMNKNTYHVFSIYENINKHYTFNMWNIFSKNECVLNQNVTFVLLWLPIFLIFLF